MTKQASWRASMGALASTSLHWPFTGVGDVGVGDVGVGAVGVGAVGMGAVGVGAVGGGTEPLKILKVTDTFGKAVPD